MVVDDDDGIDGRFDDRPDPLLALAERLFHFDAAAQVMEDAGEGRLAFDLHTANREMQRERGAVLAASANLSPRADNLGDPGLQVVSQVPVVLLAVGAGHQELDVLAQHLFCAVPKQSRGAWIERQDESLGVDDDDAVYGGLENRFEGRFHMAWYLKWEVLGFEDVSVFAHNPALEGQSTH